MTIDHGDDAAALRAARVRLRDDAQNRPDPEQPPGGSPVSTEALLATGRLAREGLLAETMRMTSDAASGPATDHAIDHAADRATDPAMRAATLPPAASGRAASDGARSQPHRTDRTRGADRTK